MAIRHSGLWQKSTSTTTPSAKSYRSRFKTSGSAPQPGQVGFITFGSATVSGSTCATVPSWASFSSSWSILLSPFEIAQPACPLLNRRAFGRVLLCVMLDFYAAMLEDGKGELQSLRLRYRAPGNQLPEIENKILLIVRDHQLQFALGVFVQLALRKLAGRSEFLLFFFFLPLFVLF